VCDAVPTNPFSGFGFGQACEMFMFSTTSAAAAAAATAAATFVRFFFGSLQCGDEMLFSLCTIQSATSSALPLPPSSTSSRQKART